MVKDGARNDGARKDDARNDGARNDGKKFDVDAAAFDRENVPCMT